MKLRLLALILTLSLVVWAQGSSAPSAPNSTPAPAAKSCCHHGDHMKDAVGCCHHDQGDAKEAMACCSKDKCERKHAKSCCQDKDMKGCMQQCQKDGKGCGGDGRDCCGSGGDKTTANGCGNSSPRHQRTTTAS